MISIVQDCHHILDSSKGSCMIYHFTGGLFSGGQRLKHPARVASKHKCQCEICKRRVFTPGSVLATGSRVLTAALAKMSTISAFARVWGLMCHDSWRNDLIWNSVSESILWHRTCAASSSCACSVFDCPRSFPDTHSHTRVRTRLFVCPNIHRLIKLSALNMLPSAFVLGTPDE